MEGKSTFTQKALDYIETFISLITTGEITDKVVKFVGLLVLAVWLYCGVKLFIDARKRYKLNVPLQVLLGILGIITGPIGLLFYILTRPKYTQEEVDFLRTEHKFYYQQASKVVECINCGKYLPEGHEFCTHCGEQNRLRCTNCNNLTNFDDKYCFYCGFEFGDDRKETHLKALEAKTALRLNDKQDPEILHEGIEDEKKDNILKNKLAGIMHMTSRLPFAPKQSSTKAVLNFDVKTKDSISTIVDSPEVENENPKEEMVEIKEEDEIVAKAKNTKPSKREKKSAKKAKSEVKE